MTARPWLLLVSLAILAPSRAFAQAKAPEPRFEETLRYLELNAKETALEDQKSRLAFEAEMRKLAVLEKRMALERESKQPTGRPPMCAPLGCGPGDRRCPLFRPGVFLAACAITHLLLAWWVNDDVKRRKVGSRIWVVVALFTGLLGTFVYAVVRIGDRPAA
jgi:hypothetical protein